MAGLGKLCTVPAIKTVFNSGLRAHRRLFSATAACRNDAVGFVGLGNMGAHMARNLLKKGYPVVAFDLSKDAVKSVAESGATAAGSPAEVASQTKLLVTMLPASPHVTQAYTGPSGILSAAQPGTLCLDSSTIDASISNEMEKAALSKDVMYMDAPVSGGVNAARDAVLTFMVGGSQDTFGKAKALLDNMGKNVIHCGPVGTGQAAKICNNMLLGISMIGTAETMNLGVKLGLEPKLLAQILNMSSGRCWSSELYNPCPGVSEGIPSSNNYQGGFGTALMLKDLGLSQTASTEQNCATPLGAMAQQIYRLMVNSGYKEKDFSSIYLFLQDMEKKS